MNVLPCLVIGAVVCTAGCNRGAASAKDRVEHIRDDIVAGRWLDLAQYISPDNREGFAMSPKQLASFLQAYANAESRDVVFRSYIPDKIDPNFADSARQQTVYLRAIRSGLPETSVMIVARHAGGDQWLVTARELDMQFLGVLHPDFDERYRCIGKALMQTGIPMYGWRGHFTTAARIQAYLDGKIDRSRIYSADPNANPV